MRAVWVSAFKFACEFLGYFAGGGAIPLEALRLGCETYALEYNPVAVLILKAVLEYPQKFGKKRQPPKERFITRIILPLRIFKNGESGYSRRSQRKLNNFTL